MDYIINELSLTGQFPDIDTFAENGLKKMVELLKEIRRLGFSTILKKSDLYSVNICANTTLHDLNTSKASAFSDRWRALRSMLAYMQNDPYWDYNPKQDMSKKYLLLENGKDIDVSCSSVSEVSERKDTLLLSFTSEEYNSISLVVKREDCDLPNSISNVLDVSQLRDLLFNTGLLNVKEYFENKFSAKFSFRELDPHNGFGLIDQNNVSLFLSTFANFEHMTWQQIRTSDGLDYKPFKKSKQTKGFFSKEYWDKGIKKFRVNQKIRCFGYESGDMFHVLRFDLDHILSDYG